MGVQSDDEMKYRTKMINKAVKGSNEPKVLKFIEEFGRPIESLRKSTSIPSNNGVVDKIETTDLFITPKPESTSKYESRHHSFAFTLNNWTDNDLGMIGALFEYKVRGCDYICIGFEIAPTTGTPHLQCFIHFKQAVKNDIVHHLLEERAYVRPRLAKSTDDKAIAYCQEDQDYYEYGIRPENGKNTTGKVVIDSILGGMSIEEAYEAFPSYMTLHGTKVKDYFSIIKKTPDTEFYVIEPVIDALDEVHNYFDTLPNLAVVTELKQLAAFPSYENVLYILPLYETCNSVLHNLWARKVAPITYSYGYQTVTVKCERFIIASQSVEKYGSFISIPRLGQKDVKEEELIGLDPVNDKLSAAARRKAAADVNLKKVLYEINLEKRRQLVNKTKGEV